MSEWERVRLGDVVDEITVGFVGPMASEYRDHGIPFLRSQNVLPHRLDLQDVKFIGSEFHERIAKSTLRPGDVVTVRTGKPGTTVVIPPGSVEMNCADLVVTRPGRRVDSRWLSYYLNSIASGAIAVSLVGAVQQHFNVGAAKALELLLPSSVEQEATADLLGALDDKIAANLRTSSLVQELAACKYSVVAGGLTPCVTFEEICQIGGGGTPKTSVAEYWDGEVPWVTPTDVTALAGPYIDTTSRRISDAGLAACSSPLYPKGSILMTSRATIGAFAVASRPMAVNQGFIVVNPHDESMRWWIFHEMRSRVDEFVTQANGATFLELSRGKFKKFGVRLAEESVMRKFSDDAGALHAVALNALAESRTLAALRDVLLPQLISGRLRVKDAEKQVEAVA